MSLAIVDAREWQRGFDLRTGRRLEPEGPLAGPVREVLARHPYPGDLDDRSNAWVTDVALDAIRACDPQLVFLIYADQYYRARYQPMTAQERAAMLAAAAAEVDRFLAASGFAGLIVGTGDLAGLEGAIDLTALDGLALLSNWSARYAGLHEASEPDLRRLREDPRLERVVSRAEFLALFGGSPEQGRRVPDHLLVAREGWTFKTLGQVSRTVAMAPAASARRVPVVCSWGSCPELTGIRSLVEAGLRRGRTALILMEGLGVAECLWPCVPVRNGRDWFFYEPGDGLALTLTAGRHRPFDYPVGYKAFEESPETGEYPLSGYFTSIPQGTLGAAFPGRSLAVGNRSMLTHMVTGADVAIECFARNLYNQGTLAVLHRQDKLR